MTKKNARNEAVKLTANWFNGASLTISGAGVALPLLSRYLGFGSGIPQSEYFWYSIVVFFGCSMILHLLGQYVIGGVVD